MEKVWGSRRMPMATKPLKRVKKVVIGPSFSIFSVTNSFALLDASWGDRSDKIFCSYSLSSSPESLSAGCEYFNPPYR